MKSENFRLQLSHICELEDILCPEEIFLAPDKFKCRIFHAIS
jgi:hypothetical protein